MSLRSRLLLGAFAASAFLSACASDATSPSSPVAGSPSFSGRTGSVDTSTVSGGGSNSGGTTSGGGSTSGGTYASCGTLSADVQTYNIVVYTTRIGIGFSGTAYNCGAKNESFDIEVVDQEPNPACVVDVPHFIAAKNTAPGETLYWNANSTLVPCMNTLHTFTLTLIDTRTGQTLETKTVSAFL